MQLDQASSVRKGEELQQEKLKNYLRNIMDSPSATLEIKQFPSGFSNLTYLINFDGKPYVLRRPPFGANVKSGHDMGREYTILSALENHYGKSPKPIHFCKNTSILEVPFYLMERVEGTILRAGTPQSEMPSEEQFQKLSKAFVTTLNELHQLDYQAVGLGELGHPDGYAERQVNGWVGRYEKAKTHEHQPMEATAKWLLDHLPCQQYKSLVHNDFKYDNLVLVPDRSMEIKAVLDWEMTTLGDPLMDLGTSLGYWIHHTDPDFLAENQLNLTTQPGNPSREELVELYARESGRNVDDIVFYFVFGVFKIAVIVQQIYYRYAKGYTRDPRFKNLDKIVEIYGVLAQQAIAKNRLDHLF